MTQQIYCMYAFCAAEMAGELVRNLSGKLPIEGLAPVFGVKPFSASNFSQQTGCLKSRKPAKLLA
ncbi:hypothetical protein ACUZ9P_08620 [Desulfovibrio sp. QI0430]